MEGVEWLESFRIRGFRDGAKATFDLKREATGRSEAAGISDRLLVKEVLGRDACKGELVYERAETALVEARGVAGAVSGYVKS